jgi:hypothetical protein
VDYVMQILKERRGELGDVVPTVVMLMLLNLPDGPEGNDNTVRRKKILEQIVYALEQTKGPSDLRALAALVEKVYSKG